nr:MAG TPA: hypothetical protein [Caudoviricetes sp.]
MKLHFRRVRKLFFMKEYAANMVIRHSVHSKRIT